MPTTEQTHNNIYTVSQKYARLQGHFQSFYDSATGLAKQPPLLAGFTIEALTQGSRFKVAWCGRVLEFMFSVKLSADNSALGVLTCVEPNIFSDHIQPKEIGRYFFKPNGFILMEVEPPSDIEDNMVIDYQWVSHYIVCRCFEQVLQQ